MLTMRLMLAALIATTAIAIVAAVFAIWPVVADAPWEDELPTPVVVEERTERCRRMEQAYLDSVVIEASYEIREYLREETNKYCNDDHE